MKQKFIVKKWSTCPAMECAGDIPDQAELLSDLPRMLRRRLSPLAKMVFCAAIPCLGKKNDIPIVFSSTHGELAKSFQMMQQIEKGEEISPTLFSLSVHNAIAGLFSIAFNNQRQSIVVAPGEIGVAAAFIEAVGLLEEGENEVLIVLYDEPLVDFYPSAPFRLTADSMAIALRISKSGHGIPMYFNCLPANTTGDDDAGEQPIQVPMLIDFLSTNQNKLLIKLPQLSYCWEK